MSEKLERLRAARAAARDERGRAAGRLAAARTALASARDKDRARLTEEHARALAALQEARAGERQALDAIRGELPRLVADPVAQIGALDARFPVALLPVRLETRFRRDTGSRGGRLLVRIYPDGLLAHGHEPLLTDGEAEAGEAYWRRVHDGMPEAESWTLLVGEATPERAAWIVRRTEPAQDGGGHPVFPPREPRPVGWHRAPEAPLLPDRWIVTCFRGGAVVHRAIGKPVREGLALTLRMSADGEEAGLDDSVALTPDGLSVEPELRWAYGFDEAVEAGMAVAVEVTAADLVAGFDTVLATGVRTTAGPQRQAEELAELFDGLRFSRGLAFVPQGAKTNNSAHAPTDYPPADPAGAASFAVARGAPRAAPGTDGHRFMRALGLDPATADQVAGAERDEQTPARAMADVLWPATLGHFLDQMMTPDIGAATAEALRAHADAHVRPRGPLPAFRAGAVPYGLLPVSALSRWTPGRDAEQPLGHTLPVWLRRLMRVWRTAAGTAPHLGRSSDPDADLIETLGQHASAQGAQIRKVLGPDLHTNMFRLLGLDLGPAGKQVVASSCGARCSGMGRPEGIEDVLAAKFQVLLPHLDERQRRLAIGAEARSLGHGGIRLVAAAAGVREGTVSRGVAELESGQAPSGRVRRPGGGRKKATELDAGLRPALLALVEPDERGDPMSPLRWTTKSTRKLAVELTRQGHRVSADTVAGLLREEGFSLQANAKTIEGAQHPDRDAQFRYLNEQARDHRDAGDPVISVDSKKKELIGDYKNAGREWRPAGQPVRVKTHDFPGQAEKAIPYGIYDMAANTGWVTIGTDHDTAAFAVASIRRWWQARGRHDYTGARRLLITADGGGSNGYRTRGWKTELADLAAETGLEITVCHLPPGTSKWNKIEHRLFSHITINWRGRPLTSHEVMLQTIAATTSRTGLTVHAELDSGEYPTGIRISDEAIAALPITRHRFHGDWNYTFHPADHLPCPDLPQQRGRPAKGSRPLTLHDLQHPELTGMSRERLSDLTHTLVPALEEHREQVRHAARGGPRRVAPGTGRKPTLTPSDQILVTILYLRKHSLQELLGQLFNTTAMTISRAVQDVRPLLEPHGVYMPASTARFRTPADITRFLDLDESKIKPTC